MNRFGQGVWAELALEALASLRAQGRRSFLALLGVMIGSASVVALMSFSNIAKVEVMARFQQVGVDTVQIEADHTSAQGLDPMRLDAVLQNLRDVVVTANMAVGRSYVQVGGRGLLAGIAAVSPDALDMLHLQTVQGRGLTLLDGCNGAVVLGGPNWPRKRGPAVAIQPISTITDFRWWAYCRARTSRHSIRFNQTRRPLSACHVRGVCWASPESPMPWCR